MTFRGIALALCAAAVGFGQTDWRFAQPDADLRMSLNLQAVLKSPSVNAALKQAEQGATKEQASQIQMVVTMLSAVDRIAISARQPAPSATKPKAAATAASAAANSDALVLVTGAFDPKIVLGLFPSTGTSKVQQVGPNAILIGEGDSFAKALGRMSGAAAAAPADELAESDLWIAGNASLMSDQAAANPTTAAFKDLKRFSLGINFTASPEVNVHLTASDSAGAGRMLATLQAMTALAGAASPQAPALEKMLQFSQDGARVKVHMVIPPEVLQMAQTMATQNLSSPGSNGNSVGISQLAPLLQLLGMSSAAGASAAPAPPPPAPKPSGDVVIYGLDGGPRVIKQQ